MASRYNSYDSRSSTSSYFSDPSSSTEALNFKKPTSTASRALVVSKPSDLSSQTKAKSNKSPGNLTAMVRKLMEKKSSSSGKKGPGGLVIPSDVIAADLKKTARKGAGLVGLQKKLFGKENQKERKEVKALTEARGGVGNNANTRTLSMVLKSERELLSANRELEVEVSELKMTLEEKNREVEKLKDLCLKQREEIKSLKSAILFPDVMNSQLQELLEKQGSELKQAKQLIPTLQRQVTSLTGQLQCLAEDLAEVKADKYGRAYLQHRGSSPRTPSYEHDEAANSLEFSSSGAATPGSPDDMFIKDLNPCLTPYYAKTKSKDYEGMGYDSSLDKSFSENSLQMSGENNMRMSDQLGFYSHQRTLSKSSDCCQSSNRASARPRAARRSDESRGALGKQFHRKQF